MSDLHFAHFVCLELRCAVVMDKANTACELQDEETGEGVSDHRHAWARGARGVLYGSGELTAIAMAMPASVTVSIGEETSGVLRVIFLVRAEVRSCRDQGHQWGTAPL